MRLQKLKNCNAGKAEVFTATFFRESLNAFCKLKLGFLIFVPINVSVDCNIRNDNKIVKLLLQNYFPHFSLRKTTAK